MVQMGLESWATHLHRRIYELENYRYKPSVNHLIVWAVVAGSKFPMTSDSVFSSGRCRALRETCLLSQALAESVRGVRAAQRWS